MPPRLSASSGAGLRGFDRPANVFPPPGGSMTEMLLVFTSFANEEDGARIVRALVEERLIACGNLLPGARSIYRWKEGVADEGEVVAILKTRKQDWTALL